MAEFLMVYHGGSMPETNDEIVHEMARWGDWMNSLGGQLIKACPHLDSGKIELAPLIDMAV